VNGRLPELNIKFVERESVADFSFRPNKVAGVCGGGNAINLAFHFGASRIVLMGYDMQNNGHFHDRHKRDSLPSNYDRFRNAIKPMARHLKNRGVEVINANPESALDCFPRVRFEEIEL